jgi:hypothetical protein
MVRMSHPQHGFAMVSGLERPAFDAAGWTVEDADLVQVQAEPEPEPAKPRRRRVKNDDSL